jgi:hypothetical protein
MDKFGVITEGKTPKRNPGEKTVEQLDDTFEKKAADRVEAKKRDGNKPASSDK